jgi:hypothetical protein
MQVYVADSCVLVRRTSGYRLLSYESAYQHAGGIHRRFAMGNSQFGKPETAIDEAPVGSPISQRRPRVPRAIGHRVPMNPDTFRYPAFQPRIQARH